MLATALFFGRVFQAAQASRIDDRHPRSLAHLGQDAAAEAEQVDERPRPRSRTA
jgi:hypothetical protein